MAQAGHGVTGPISEALPSKYDEEKTEKLIAAMQPFGVYESEAEMNKRLAEIVQKHILQSFMSPSWCFMF